jgi:hypothetical protein
MPLEVLHFRDADKILKKKHLVKDVKATLDYVGDALYGSLYRGELLRMALEEMGWRENGSLSILEGRRYRYKGFKKGVAVEGSFAAYEYIHEGLFRLQLGFDKGLIEAGILLLTGQRSEKSKLGSSAALAREEVEQLYPTISMPLTIALFDLGRPELPDDPDEEGGEGNGLSVPADETGDAASTNQAA